MKTAAAHLKHHLFTYRYVYILFLLYAAVRMWLFTEIPTVHSVALERGADARKYLFFAQHAIFGLHPTHFLCFIGGTFEQAGVCNRPFVYPLFISTLQVNLPAVYIGQLIISILSWFILAKTCASLCHTLKVKWAIFIAILMVSLGPTYIIWDAKILTESLTLSFGILVFCALIWNLKHNFRWPYVIALIIFTIAFTNLRDTSTYLALFMGFLLLAYAFIQRQKVALLPVMTIFIATLLCFGFAHFTAQRGERAGVVFSDNWVMRSMQQDPEAVSFFKSHNAPNFLFHAPPPYAPITQKPGLAREMHIINDINHINASTFYNASEARRHWMATQGARLYKEFLLTHPSYFAKPLAKPAFYLSWLGSPLLLGVDYYAYGSFKIKKEGVLSHYNASALPFFNTFSNSVLIILFFSWLALFLLNLKRLYNDYFTVFAFFTFLCSVFLALLIWVGEPMEILRHELFATILFELALFVGAARAWDSYFTPN